LDAHGIRDGIVADLGCGTGELTLMLAPAGYHMIAIDQSEEMLCVVRANADQLELTGRALLLEQALGSAGLYGTTRAAATTFDTFNHLPQLDAAIANAGSFMEKGGVLLFDMNTPYKRREVLGNNTFTFADGQTGCVWRNRLEEDGRRVRITLEIQDGETGEAFREEFCEYTYALAACRASLERIGFTLELVCDVETFGHLVGNIECYFFCAVKNYTQLEEEDRG